MMDVAGGVVDVFVKSVGLPWQELLAVKSAAGKE